jgi:hypothetical protein
MLHRSIGDMRQTMRHRGIVCFLHSKHCACCPATAPRRLAERIAEPCGVHLLELADVFAKRTAGVGGLSASSR